jgi:predicted RNA-binding protein with PIN domain
VTTEADGIGSVPDLPEPVRVRVVTLSARVLPLLTPLPAPLRTVASFAPGRRTRLGASQIAAALDADADLGRRVATQTAATDPALGALLTAGEPPATADPVDVAALLWLSRPEGWRQPFARAVRRIEERDERAAAERAQADLQRAEQRVEDVEESLREARARHRDRVEELKGENTVLRRKLGEARVAERDARTAADEAVTERDRAAAAAGTAVTAAESEVRRLRAQVEELQAAVGAGRSQARAEREEVTTRARILLDTVIEAAAGLRRELALPAVAESPGVRAEAEIAADAPGPAAETRTSTVSPAVLEQLLSRPRSRLIVDGYNVTKEAYPSSSLEAQRVRLVQALAPLVGRTGAETTVVFDAAASTHRPVVPGPRSVRVVFSPPGVIADDVIRRLVEAEPDGRATVVVTSDQEVQRDVTRAGARAVEARVLVSALAR